MSAKVTKKTNTSTKNGNVKQFRTVRSRGWCFTLNNYTDDDVTMFNNLGKGVEEGTVAYMVFGKEVGQNGTPHLQGYIRFVNARSGASMKKLQSKAHWEAQRGTNFDASVYCKKDNDFTEYGKAPSQGRSAKLDEVAKYVATGMTKEEVVEKYPGHYAKYHAGLDKILLHSQKPRDQKPYVTWVCGPGGCGKTKFCKRQAREAGHDYFIKLNNQWWCTYKQGDYIILDDFDGRWEIHDLLRLLDWNKYVGQVKGGNIQVNSPRIYITADRPPTVLFADILSDALLHQFMRRVDEVIEYDPCDFNNIIRFSPVLPNDSEIDPFMYYSEYNDLNGYFHAQRTSSDSIVKRFTRTTNQYLPKSIWLQRYLASRRRHLCEEAVPKEYNSNVVSYDYDSPVIDGDDTSESGEFDGTLKLVSRTVERKEETSESLDEEEYEYLDTPSYEEYLTRLGLQMELPELSEEASEDLFDDHSTSNDD